MRIWALADLHLSFGIPNKSMDVFGEVWKDHAKQIEEAWLRLIHKDDLVLIPGDISWAMRVEEAVPDLQWIHRLPGTKVLLKGNHDFWWGSLKKIAPVLPPSLHLIQNNSFNWKDAAIGGARLWDTPEYSFGSFIEFVENPREKPQSVEESTQEDLSEKIFERELARLDTSLSTLSPHAKLRIAMTHYPPIGADLQPSRASRILEKHGIQIVVFGHLHNVKAGLLPFGEKNGVRYILASGDYVRFQPVPLL
jgi:predicted phosphohydrolase